MKFSELQLKPRLLQGLHKMKFEDLTPIQEQTFTHILGGRDVLATAETGSGKTGACAVPLLQQVDPSLNAIQALVLVPTRELALQYVEEIGKISQYLDIATFAVYGGFSQDVQLAKLNHSVHVLIATTGRLIDLLYNGHLSLKEVRTLILDEADEMLKMGFLDDIDSIFSCLLHKHQTLLFSATMPAAIMGLAKSYLNDPVTLELNLEQRAPQSLQHHFKYIHRTDRTAALSDYLNSEAIAQAIVFCNTRGRADRLFQRLSGSVDSVEIIHGGLEQSKRTSIIRRFRNHRINFLVATDLAGRGMDFSKVTHIINHDLPQTPVVYTHRTGRAGRMGRVGIAVTLVSDREVRAVRQLISVNRIKPFWIGGEPPGNSERPHYSDRPRHSERPRYSDRSRYSERPRPQERSRRSKQP